MAQNPADVLSAKDLGDYLARLTSGSSLVEILLAKLGVMQFDGAALGLDDFSSAELTGRYRRGFDLKDHVMVFVGGLSSHIFLFDSVYQMDRLRGKFGSSGISGAYAIPNDLWHEIAATIIPNEIEDFRTVT